MAVEPRVILENEIVRELEQRRSLPVEHVLRLVEAGQTEEAADHLVFFSSPGEFAQRSRELREFLASQLRAAGREWSRRCLSCLSHLAVDLSSLLVQWNLQAAAPDGAAALSDQQLKGEIEATLAPLSRWEKQFPAAAKQLLDQRREQARARYIAEKAADPEAMADRLVGKSLGDWVQNVASSIADSSLSKIARMRFAGQNDTELGNDYATFLKYTMYLGASFVTTNPVLVDVAWDADPAHWDPVMKRLVRDNPRANAEDLARLATLEVVLENMRLLRPVFLLTRGSMGCVSLQVNPKKHGDRAAMIADAVAMYQELNTRLNGGVPNVVFKLPGTLAGLEACRSLTAQGIGVNITVNFGLFQQVRFAEAIHKGQAIFSTLTEMNGRLAFPVRDELLGRLPELVRHGIHEADALEAAAWSGVAVLKKLHRWMAHNGYDVKRIRPLVASLRIYKDGPGYARLPTAYPDITEDVGTSIITVFPNIRHAFDLEPDVPMNPRQIGEPVPERVLQVLAHSEIFKQAYYMADGSGGDTEDERFRPTRVLALEDEGAVASWPPVGNTLSEFAKSYDRFVQRLIALR
jgi:hypothetical protein